MFSIFNFISQTIQHSRIDIRRCDLFQYLVRRIKTVIDLSSCLDQGECPKASPKVGFFSYTCKFYAKFLQKMTHISSAMTEFLILKRLKCRFSLFFSDFSHFDDLSRKIERRGIVAFRRRLTHITGKEMLVEINSCDFMLVYQIFVLSLCPVFQVITK